MKKGIGLILCLVLLSGCAPQGQPPTDSGSAVLVVPQIEAGYWQLLCENMEFTGSMYGGRNAWVNLAFFYAGEEDISGEKLSIRLENAVEFEVKLFPMDMDARPSFGFHTFLSYQGFDWETVGTEPMLYQQAQLQYESVWPDIQQNITPIHLYQLDIKAEDLGLDSDALYARYQAGETVAPVEVGTVTVTFRDQTKVYDTGYFCFSMEHYYAQMAPVSAVSPLISSGGSSYGGGIEPSEAGRYTVTDIELHALENVTLEKISLWEEADALVADCAVTIELPTGGTLTLTWDGNSPLELDKGAKLFMDVTVEDPLLARKLVGTVSETLLLHYICQGEIGCIAFFWDKHIIPDGYDLYAMQEDGIDLWPQYRFEGNGTG